MAIRKINFENGQYYHVFNRGTEKKIIFHDKEDIHYFFDRLLDFNNTEAVGGIWRQKFPKYKKVRSKASHLVSIIAYCLLPNHFHLILKQESENGISKFMQRIGTGYAKYYNKKYKRNGSLFQGKFKATYLNKEGSLDLTSVYVNLNYKHHKINPEKNLVKTSLFEYIKTEQGECICNQEEVKKIMGTVNSYKKYLKNQGEYFFERKGHNLQDIDFDELE